MYLNLDLLYNIKKFVFEYNFDFYQVNYTSGDDRLIIDCRCNQNSAFLQSGSIGFNSKKPIRFDIYGNIKLENSILYRQKHRFYLKNTNPKRNIIKKMSTTEIYSGRSVSVDFFELLNDMYTKTLEELKDKYVCY